MDGVEQAQPAVLCEAFKRYFSSIFRNEGGNNPPLKYPANNHMRHLIISAEDVHRQLTYLNTNKSEGAGEIHPKILASLAFFLAMPLAKLYNSLATSEIPVEWKSSVICPIYKKGSKNNVTNYRPIYLTSVVCKTVERIVKAKILQYLVTREWSWFR